MILLNFALREIYKSSDILIEQNFVDPDLLTFDLPNKLLEPTLEPPIYLNSLKLCETNEELFQSTFKIVFFQIISPDLIYENRQILFSYILKHQKKLIEFLSLLFDNEQEMESFLDYISPTANEDKPFCVKESYSLVYLLLFFGYIYPNYNLENLKIFCEPIISSMFTLDPNLNKCELFIFAIAFIGKIYGEEFPYFEEIMEYINEYFITVDINNDSDEENDISTTFIKLCLNQKSNNITEFLNEVCSLEDELTYRKTLI